jgi:hypothetical protein
MLCFGSHNLGSGNNITLFAENSLEFQVAFR